MSPPGLSPRQLTLLTVAAFGVRAAWLLRDPEPPGTDGYYYVVQVLHLLRDGAPHVPDASWALGFLAGVAGLVGSPIVGVKLGSALLAALCVPAAYRAGRGGPGGAWLALWAAASPTLTLYAGEFPKNLAAVAPALLVLGGGWPAVVGAVLAATAHRTGAALLLLGGLGALATAAARRAGPRHLLGGALLLAGGTLVLVTLAVWVPGLLHPDDLARVHLQTRPHLPTSYLGLRDTSVPLGIELVAGLLVLPVALGLRRPHPLLLALAVCAFPFWRDGELDLGWRLLLLVPLVAAPIVASWATRPPPRAAWLLLALSPAGLDPAAHPDYAYGRTIIAAVPRPLPALCIAPPSWSFLYDAETGAEAMAWAPEPGLDRAGIGRIVWGVRPGEWTCAHTPLAGRYAYTNEACWEEMVAAARADADEERLDRFLDPHNPSAVRPAWMLRGR